MSQSHFGDSVEDIAPLVNCQPSLTSGATRFTPVNGKLDLSGVTLDFHDVEEIATMVKFNSSLRVLKLCFNHLCPSRVKILCKAIKRSNSLEVLILGWNEKMLAEGIMYVTKALSKNKSIREVTLHKNYIDDEGAFYLFDFLKSNSTITSLSLQGNKITSKGAKKLAKALKTNTTLQYLDLRSNLIETDGALYIVKALFSNKTLHNLNLSYNSIGPLGALSFGELLLTRPALTQLGLAGTAIDDNIDTLFDAIEVNEKLQVVDLRFNKIPRISGDGLKRSSCQVILSPKDIAAF